MVKVPVELFPADDPFEPAITGQRLAMGSQHRSAIIEIRPTDSEQSPGSLTWMQADIRVRHRGRTLFDSKSVPCLNQHVLLRQSEMPRLL